MIEKIDIYFIIIFLYNLFYFSNNYNQWKYIYSQNRLINTFIEELNKAIKQINQK